MSFNDMCIWKAESFNTQCNGNWTRSRAAESNSGKGQYIGLVVHSVFVILTMRCTPFPSPLPTPTQQSSVHIHFTSFPRPAPPPLTPYCRPPSALRTASPSPPLPHSPVPRPPSSAWQGQCWVPSPQVISGPATLDLWVHGARWWWAVAFVECSRIRPSFVSYICPSQKTRSLLWYAAKHTHWRHRNHNFFCL